MPSPSIVAVIVLYRRRAEQSEAFVSLTNLLPHPPGDEDVELVVCDNSPVDKTPQPDPPNFTGPYLRDPTNPGLAKPYNQALAYAGQRAAPWLMLLDQDTTVTPEYLAELTTTIEAIRDDPTIVAIVPRLTDRGIICSPIRPPTFGPAQAIHPALTGIAQQTLFPFNSGAVLRVSALQAIGGFPQRYPLDYLDHATFAALQRNGGKLFVLRSALQHSLASNEAAPDPVRGQAVLDAEHRFYTEYGSPADRRRRVFRLLRAAAGRILRAQPWPQTARMVRSAFKP